MTYENASEMAILSDIRRRPLATLCLCYLSGALEYIAAPPGSHRLLACAGFLALLALASSGHWRSGWRTRFGQGICVLLPAVAFAAGIFVSTIRLAVPATDISHYTSAHFCTVRGVLVSEPRSLPFGVTAEMECQAVERGAAWTAVTGKTELRIAQITASGVGGQSDLHRLRPAQPIEVQGVLEPIITGSSPAADSLLRRRIFCALQVGKGGKIRPRQPDGFSPRGTLRNGCDGAMQWVMDGLSHHLEPPERDALAGMLFHRQENMTPGTLDDLQKTGTIHIVATAGLHVGIFMGCCLFILTPLIPRRTAILLTMTLLAGYCVACGGWPAVFRATVVAELYLLARLLGRLPDPLTCLSLTAALMVFLEPNALVDAGFQLTFATVGVILLFIGPSHDRDQLRDQSPRARIVQHIRGVVTLSLAAQLGSWPLTAYYFNMVSFVGFFANLLIVPLLIVIIPLAMVTALLSHLLPPIALVSGWMLQSLLHLLLWIAHQLAAGSCSWRYIENVPWSAAAFYYVVVAIGLGWMRMQSAEREEAN